ncbi:MAG TPA: O-antigen ligase family protein [Pyrinomonadaceae bacterium]|jgi:probable O-glycosylation ligase (exosortase A-associated)
MPSKLTFSDYEPVTPGRSALPSGEHATEEGWPEKKRTLAVETGPERETATPDKMTPEKAKETTNGVEPSRLTPKRGLKRGHMLSYIGLFLFTVILYFRPQELFDSLAGTQSLAFWFAVPTLLIFIPSQIALEGNLTARPREVHLALLLLLAALLSMPFALSPADAWEEFNHAFWKAVLMFIVIVNVVRTEGRLKGLMLLGIAVGCFLSIGAINDYRAGRFLIAGQRVLGVVGGMFGNPNDLALHLVTMIPLAFGLFLSTRRIVLKPLYAACMLLMVGGVVATFSRGGFLGLLGACLVFTWKLGRRNRGVVIGLLVVLIVVIFLFAPGEYASRLGSITAPGGDASSASRRDLLLRSILVALRHPLLGIGMGNFSIVAQRESVSHNAYTQVAAEMGMAATLIYVLFMVFPLKGLRLMAKATSDTRRESRIYYMSIALQASLVAYMISSFFGSVAYQYYVYYLVGYAVALRRIYEAQTGTQLIETSRKARRLPAASRRAGDSLDLPELESRPAMRA